MLFVATGFMLGGDAGHLSFGADAAVRLLLLHVLPFHLLLKSMPAFFFSAHSRTDTACYSAFTTDRGDTALYSFLWCKWGSARLMGYLGATSLSVRLRAYTPFLQLVLVLYYPF